MVAEWWVVVRKFRNGGVAGLVVKMGSGVDGDDAEC